MYTRSIVHNIIAFVALLCFDCAPTAHAQVVLDFENLSNPVNSSGSNTHGYSVTQNGFTVAKDP